MPPDSRSGIVASSGPLLPDDTDNTCGLMARDNEVARRPGGQHKAPVPGFVGAGAFCFEDYAWTKAPFRGDSPTEPAREA